MQNAIFKTWFTAALGTVLFAIPAFAQVTPPKPGVDLPPGYYEQLRRNRDAFQFKRAWKAETERVQSRREQLRREGVLSGSSVGSGVRVEGNRSVPVLAGKFANTGPDPYTDVDLQEQLFDGPNPTGTMTDYYTEVSYGYLTLSGSVIGAQGGGLFQVSRDDTYYEGGCNGLCGSAKTGEFLQELLDAADPWTNFAQYDNDGPDGIPNSGDDDGYVDFVAFVHPERGGECGGSNLWSHRWVYEGWGGSAYTTNDAAAGGGFIRVSDYVIQPILSCDNSSLIEIGVFAHEFGHAFGLPDLYDTNSDNGASAGIGEWGLMGSGSWGGDGGHPETPSHMSAWSKEQLGWVDPIVICQDQLAVSLPAAADTGVVLKVYPQGTTDNEYFLIENRVKTGFDTWIHSSGIAVWHIDNDQSGNADETHKLVDLEEADGLSGLDNNVNRGDAGDVYPGSDNIQLFDDNTTPDANQYGGSPTGLSLANFDGSTDPRSFDITVTSCQLAVGDVAVADDFWGNNNGRLDSHERASLAVGLWNDFPGDITGVSGVLTSLTAGVNVLQANVTYGTVVCGVLNYGEVAFEIESTIALNDGDPVDFQIDLTGSGGYSSTAVFTILAGEYVLLVEDDARVNNQSLFENAIAGAGYTSIRHDRSVDGLPTLGIMQGALAVVWYTGIEGTTSLNDEEQDLIADFLDAGGSLFVTGQDIGWGLVDQGDAADAAFYETYLHANFVSDTSNDNTLTGVPGDPIGDGLSLSLIAGTGAGNSTWPSRISPRAGASSVLQYSSSRYGAVRYAGVHKLVYFAFNFEAINLATARTTTMQRVLDWLVPADRTAPTVSLTAPAADDTVGACSLFPVTWSASDNDQVSEIALHLSGDSGVTWSPIATGLPNSGSYDWSPVGFTGNTFQIRILARDPGGLQGTDQTGDFTILGDLPSVNVTYPDGGEILICGDPIDIAWSMSDSCSGGLDSSRIEVSIDGGGSWSDLATVLAPDSSWTWAATDTAADSALVRVTVYDDQGMNATDSSDNVFVIADQTPPVVNLLSPLGGEMFGTGNPVDIDWLASDDKGVVAIDLHRSPDGGTSWFPVATDLPNTPPYSWITEDEITSTGLIRVEARDGFANAASDTSDSTFTVVDDDLPTVTLTAPNGGDSYQGGVAINLEADVDDNIGVDSVCVSYSLDDGASWLEIECGALSFPYSWPTPSSPSEACMVKIELWDGAMNAAADSSDSTFAIYTSTTVPTDFTGVTRPVLLQNFPNPMILSATTFAFYLPEETPVTLQVYDISGRLVRTLVNGPVGPGYHQRTWNGTSDAGKVVGQGVYFYVMTTPDRQEMRKLAKLR